MDYKDRIKKWEDDLQTRYVQDLEHYLLTINNLVINYSKNKSCESSMHDLTIIMRYYAEDIFAYKTVKSLKKLCERVIVHCLWENDNKPIWVELLEKNNFVKFTSLLKEEAAIEFINANYDKMDQIKAIMLSEYDSIKWLFESVTEGEEQ